jgi:hypothetical protein
MVERGLWNWRCFRLLLSDAIAAGHFARIARPEFTYRIANVDTGEFIMAAML